MLTPALNGPSPDGGDTYFGHARVRKRSPEHERLPAESERLGLPGLRIGVRAGSAAVSSTGVSLEIISSTCCMVCPSAISSEPDPRMTTKGCTRMETGSRLFACLSSRA
jgi:hypothetical protein